MTSPRTVLFAAFGLLAVCSSAQALPAFGSPTVETAPVTLVGYGCGPGGLPNMWGKCVPAYMERYNYARHAYDRRVQERRWRYRHEGY